MELLSDVKDKDTNDITYNNLIKYDNMTDKELSNYNEEIIEYISAHCFTNKLVSQKILERICGLNLCFYSYKLHLLFFSVIVNNKILFDYLIENDIEITNEIVIFAYHNFYMLERLLRRLYICNELSTVDKNKMWNKFIVNLSKLYDKDCDNTKKLYEFYTNVWNMKLSFNEIFELVMNGDKDKNKDMLNNIGVIVNNEMVLLFLDKALKTGHIGNYILCYENFNLVDNNYIKSKLYNTIQYIKNKLFTHLDKIITSNSNSDSNCNEILKENIGIVDDNYELIEDNSHVYDLLLFIEDIEDIDFIIDYDDDNNKYIQYEKNKDKFSQLKNNFDTIFINEYKNYINVYEALSIKN
jgi:hypothetical protein